MNTQRLPLCPIVIFLFASLPLFAADPKPKSQAPQAVTGETLPTGMSITPTAAKGSTLQALNPDLADRPDFTVDHPITTAISPDGGTLLILTSGFNRNMDAKGHAIVGQSSEYVFIYDIRRAAPLKRQVVKVLNSYAGLCWAPDGKHFYVSGGVSDNVSVFEQKDGHWVESATIALGHKAGLGVPSMHEDKSTPIHAIAAGVAVNAGGTRLLVANHENDSVTLIDTSNNQKLAELDLRPGMNDSSKKGVPGGEYPYWTLFQGNEKAYVSSLRDREIVVLDVHAVPTIAGRIKLHGQPGKMILNKAQNLLFAVADNSDSVVIIDTKTDRVIAEIKTTAPAAVFPNRDGFKGGNPTGLALSPDENTLYVTNGGTNSIAVIRLEKDLDDSRVVGLIPTGWYPNSISVSADGGLLYVVNGKGNAGPNPKGCRNSVRVVKDDRPCSAAEQYILQLVKGSFAVIPRPDAAELQSLTSQVALNNHFVHTLSKAGNGGEQDAVFSFLRQHIKHVIYIVKENRTYDQVFGDLEKGNGDPALTLFPEAMTPNHHEMARRFVTLDNFYDSGEVSGDGWNWSTAARATDLTERNVVMNYAGRGFTYDFEGTNREINVGAVSPQDRNTTKLDDPEDQLPGAADVAAPDGPSDESGAGYLWDSALRAHLSVRNYGFFADLSHYVDSPQTGTAFALLHDPAANGTRVAVPTNPRLRDLTDLYFRSFDQRFPDYWRFKEWEREFDDFVKHDNLPSLELLRICHDHFGDFKNAIDGVNTVETQMADDDYALGLVAEKVANSKYAKDTLIFVIEDDAQDGPDHVDAHRSVALVIGPYVKQGAVVSERYNTVSMLRTIEEVLGLQALGLNDAVQPPMTEIFSNKQANWSYVSRVPAVLRSTQLPIPAASPSGKSGPSLAPRHDAAYWAEKTQGYDFSSEDKINSAAFNQVLWYGLKGEGQPYPSDRDGRDLSKDRQRLLRQFNQGTQ